MSTAQGIRRIDKACERCRRLRVRCQPPYPCKGCQAAEAECDVRNKPRNRVVKERLQEDIAGSSLSLRTAPIRCLESEVQQMYRAACGLTIDLSLREEHTHPALDLTADLPPHPVILLDFVDAYSAFVNHCLRYCSFLSPPKVLALCERHLIDPASLGDDERAMVYSCLACGYVRLGYNADKGDARRARAVEHNDRHDVAWFRWAVHVLQQWGGATFTSLHALSCLWYYCVMTSAPSLTRRILAWQIDQARALGVHHEQVAMSRTFAPDDHVDLMFSQILYGHLVTCGTADGAPVIQPGEFDTILFEPAKTDVTDAAVSTHPLAVELALLNTQVLLNLHDEKMETMPSAWLLRIEERWGYWRDSWNENGQTTGSQVADPFLCILWDWGRMCLRIITLADPRYRMVSSALVARSAVRILGRYRDWYRHNAYNSIRLHLRHLTTAAHAVLFGYRQYELSKAEAEESLCIAYTLIDLMVPRWTRTALEANSKILTVATAFGLQVQNNPFLLEDNGIDWFFGDVLP